MSRIGKKKLRVRLKDFHSLSHSEGKMRSRQEISTNWSSAVRLAKTKTEQIHASALGEPTELGEVHFEH